MKNLTRRIFIPLLALLTISGVCFAATSGVQNIFSEAGRIQAEKLQGAQPNTNETVAMFATADMFHIPYAYYACTVEELQLSGHSLQEAEELATAILVEKFSLYQAAVEAQCIPSDAEVDAIIADTRAGIEVAENRTDFYDYLEGTGLSEEEYWESQFENVKIYAAIALYQEQCYADFLTNNPVVTASESSGVSAWESYWTDTVSDIIESQNIVFAP